MTIVMATQGPQIIGALTIATVNYSVRKQSSRPSLPLSTATTAEVNAYDSQVHEAATHLRRLLQVQLGSTSPLMSSCSASPAHADPHATQEVEDALKAMYDHSVSKVRQVQQHWQSKCER